MHDTLTHEPMPRTMPKLARVIEQSFARETRAEGGDDAADDKKPRRYRVVLTSETPRKTWAGMETLSHDSAAIDLSLAKRGLSVYLEHGGYDLENPDPDYHVGIVEDIELNTEKRQLEGWLRFSRHARAQAAEQDVQDGTRIWVSGSYVPLKAKETKAAEKFGEVREYTVTRWKPVECGLVGIPADPKAVIKRSEGGVEYPVEIESETPAKEPAMPPIEEGSPAAPANGAPGSAATTDPAARAARSAGGGGGAVTIDRDDVAKLMELCNSHGCPEKAPEFMRRGLSLADAGLEILESRAGKQSAAPIPSAEELGVPKRDARRYSRARAVRQAYELRSGNRGKFDGLEGELHREIEKHLPQNVERRNGILMPLRIERADDEPRATRAMGSGVAAGGAELVFDQPGDFIDLLRNKALLTMLGAQVVTGASGPVPMPKLTGDPVVRWMVENPNAGAAPSQPTFATITATPKTMIGTVPFPRQLVRLANLDIESLITRTLVNGSGLAVDRGGFHGSGVGGEPLGLWNTPGVNLLPFGGAPTYGKMVDLQGLVEDKNADSSSMGYVTTPLMKAKLKQTQVASGTNGQFIWTGGLIGDVGGYRAGATNQISKTMTGQAATGGSEHGIAFADWASIIVFFWGAIEVITDELTGADSGQIKITTFNMADVVNTRPEACAVSTGATLA